MELLITNCQFGVFKVVSVASNIFRLMGNMKVVGLVERREHRADRDLDKSEEKLIFGSTSVPIMEINLT